MALFDRRDTLAYHQSRPLTVAHALALAPCVGLAKACKAQMNLPELSPTSSAVEFYGFNQAMALVRNAFDPYEPLPPEALEIVDTYYALGSKLMQAAVTYLALITLRESRHHHTPTEEQCKEAKLRFGSEVEKFLLSSGNEEEVWQKFMGSPPAGLELGPLYNGMAWLFREKYGAEGKMWSGGYGGEPWAKTTDCLASMLDGKTTPEVLLDTVWTLAHNNGPIFNKGFIFTHDMINLQMVLDLQRSGQVLEMSRKSKDMQVPKSMSKLLSLVDDLFPGAVAPRPCWYKVEALGAVNNYSYLQKLQKKEGYSTQYSEAAGAKIVSAENSTVLVPEELPGKASYKKATRSKAA